MSVAVDLEVPVEMRDGVVLRADVYRPSSNPGLRYPTLLTRTQYSKDNYMVVGLPLDPMMAVRSGYAVVVQDVRGRFASGGDYYPFTSEAADGYDTVEWCAAQPWSDGQVGMYGSSYMAATAMLAASAAPPHLVGAIPNQASGDFYDGRTYRGGRLELGAMLSVAALMVGPGSVVRDEPSEDVRRSRLRALREICDDFNTVASDLPLSRWRDGVLGAVTPFLFDWIDHDHYDDYWAAIDLCRRHAAMKIPALHMGCWYDASLVGTLRNFRGMQVPGSAEQRLILGPWTHHSPMSALLGSARVGDANFGVASMLNFDRVQLRWFDGLMKESGKQTGPPVRIFVMGVNEWRGEEAWPLQRAVDTPLYLASSSPANSVRGGGRLQWDGPGSDRGEDLYRYDPADPVRTVGGAHLMIATWYPAGSYDQAVAEARDDVLVYTSAPVARDMEVTGWLRLELWVASTAPDTDFVARLVDVHPDGAAFNLCEGIQRLGARESLVVDAAYSPGTPVRISIDMTATSHVFRAGHAVRLEITSSNFPRYARSLNTGGSWANDAEVVTATQTILHSSAHPSFLELPVVSR